MSGLARWRLVIALVLVVGMSGLTARGASPARERSSGRKTATTDKGKATGKKGDASETTGKKRDKKKDAEEAVEPEEELFLKEGTDQQKFLPDLFRCPECGYEQDEPGSCPDHDSFVLVKVLSKGKNPLTPTEVDGNEDLVVDIPLTGLTLRPVLVSELATASPDLDKPSGQQKGLKPSKPKSTSRR